MKLKLVVVDLELSSRQKRVLSLGLGAAIAMATAVALADAPHAFVAGETLRAEDLNKRFGDLEDGVAAHQVQIDTLTAGLDDMEAQIEDLVAAAHPPSAFRARRTTALSLPSTAGTKVVFNTEDYDFGSEHDPVTGLFTPSEAGFYLVECGVHFLPTQAPSATVFSSQLFASNQELAGDDEASTQGHIDPVVSRVLHLEADVPIECRVYQNTGATQSVFLGFSDRDFFAAIRLK